MKIDRMFFEKFEERVRENDFIAATVEAGVWDPVTNPVFSTRDLTAVPEKYRSLIPEYIKDNVSLNQFVA